MLSYFDGLNQYPAVTGYYQQRKVYGGSAAKPDSLFYSAIGDFSKFIEQSIISKDDDPISTTLSSGELNRIRHLVTLNDLLVLTDSTQWQVKSSSGSGFSAKTNEQRPQTRIGISYIAPIVFNDTVVIIREGSKEVVGLGFSNERGGYVAVNLSLLSKHLFEDNPIVSIDGFICSLSLCYLCAG